MDKNIIINNKEYIITTTYNDEKYGEILKAISKTISNYERIYLLNQNGNYEQIVDSAILEYIKNNYEIDKNFVI